MTNHYFKAQRVRRVLRDNLLKSLQQVDLIITPTVPVAAPKIGQRTVEIDGREIGINDVLSRLTGPFNLCGVPAISLPCGFTASGLPVGVQIVGRPFDEGTVLRVAAAYEASTGWREKSLPVSS
jgi:aspartyl-tRNA(Asn)/glutamyl-tRNA(Gln) amidotransferase subunit A